MGAASITQRHVRLYIWSHHVDPSTESLYYLHMCLALWRLLPVCILSLKHCRSDVKCLPESWHALIRGKADLDASPSSKYGLQLACSEFGTRCDHELQQQMSYMKQ